MECFKDLKVNYSMDKNEMIKALFHLKEILDESKIDFWLDAGTLLGAIRENKIIEWDDDIDICIWNTDMDKIIKLRDKIDRSDFELYIIPIHFFPFSFGHYGLRTKKNKKHVLCIFSCFIYDNNVVWMRVLPLIGNVLRYLHSKKNDLLYSIFWVFITKFRLYKIQRICYPLKMLGSFKDILFYKKTFKIPYMPEDCLHLVYGNWKLQKRREEK